MIRSSKRDYSVENRRKGQSFRDSSRHAMLCDEPTCGNAGLGLAFWGKQR